MDGGSGGLWMVVVFLDDDLGFWDLVLSGTRVAFTGPHFPVVIFAKVRGSAQSFFDGLLR